METNNNNSQSFWQFTDQLRLQNNDFANLSLNDSIWSVAASKRPESRRNFDIRVGGDFNTNNLAPIPIQTPKTPIAYNNYDHFKPQSSPDTSDFNSFNDGWKIGNPIAPPQNNNINGGFNKGMYTKPYMNQYFNNFSSGVNNFNGKVEEEYNNNMNNNNYQHGMKLGKKKKEGKKEFKDENNNKSGVDKRFKTLPPTEALPRNETIGGYIFVCNNDTMEENLKRQLFGLPPRYRDSVRAITPGLPLFLYNYSTHQLHGIYEAASFGGSNLDPTAWEDKKNHGESRFPAQVRVQTRKICEPLEEDAFRPNLHHYDGPKFRLELSVPEVLSLLDIFEKTEA